MFQVFGVWKNLDFCFYGFAILSFIIVSPVSYKRLHFSRRGPARLVAMLIAEHAVPAATTLIVFTTLALIIVVGRLCTRTFLVKNVGVDDYLIVGAMVRFPSSRDSQPCWTNSFISG